MPRPKIDYLNARRAGKAASGGKNYSKPPKYAPDDDAAHNDEPFNWRDHLAVHPAADLFPLMSEAELKELAADIKKHGLAEPVALYNEYPKDADGNVSLSNHRIVLIDGRKRLDALDLLAEKIFDKKGLVLEAISHFPDEPKDNGPANYVISRNIHRRHLTAEQRRDLIAKVLKANPDQSNNQVAKQVKADDKTVAKVRRDLESTSEIPKLDKTVGADGKARKLRKRRSPEQVRDRIEKQTKSWNEAQAKRDPLDAHAAGISAGVDAIADKYIAKDGGPPRTEKSAEVSIEQRRAENADLDLSAEEKAAERSVFARQNFATACRTWLPLMTDIDQQEARQLVIEMTAPKTEAA
jgi:hypothetical protein